MQENILLTKQTANLVDARVAKILKDLGNPAPPLDLADVRELLKLDLRFYSTADTSWIQEKIHQLKVAGKQVLSKPSTILEVTRSLGLKGILLVDRRRILLDNDQPEPKLRWNQAHEIVHDILPWHKAVAHGDPEEMLAPSCHEIIESEANYGAGRLLFCGDGFIERVRSSEFCFALVQELKEFYKNTMTTTFWRTVEATNQVAFGLITAHPLERAGDMATDVRYFVRSPTFLSQFSHANPVTFFDAICRQCHGRRGPIGAGSIILLDDNGASRSFAFETFWNHHDALTLAKCA